MGFFTHSSVGPRLDLRPHHRECALGLLDGAAAGQNLAAKFKENENLVFENLSEYNYSNPPQGSYFSHVIERKKKLEDLYNELLQTPTGTSQETEAIQRLIRQVLG